jgi:hypothetical protein
MRLPPLFIIMFATVAADVAAADTPSLAGKWTVHMNIAGNEADLDCTFAQKDGQLTGSCTSEQASGPIKGTVDGNKAKWTLQNEKNGTAIEYEGTVAADGKITGKNNVPQYSVNGEFAATRVK